MHSMLFFSGGGHLRPLEATKSQDFELFEKKLSYKFFQKKIFEKTYNSNFFSKGQKS